MSNRVTRYQAEECDGEWKPIGIPCALVKTARRRATRSTLKTRIIRITREIVRNHEVK